MRIVSLASPHDWIDQSPRSARLLGRRLVLTLRAAVRSVLVAKTDLALVATLTVTSAPATLPQLGEATVLETTAERSTLAIGLVHARARCLLNSCAWHSFAASLGRSCWRRGHYFDH